MQVDFQLSQVLNTSAFCVAEMALTVLDNVQNVIVNTGNILSLNDITKKPGQNPSEELVEVINITLKDPKNGSAPQIVQNGAKLVINRGLDDLQAKMAEHDVGELKIGLKVFLNSDDEVFLNEALDKAFLTLNVSSIQNVIVAYNYKQKEGQNHVADHIRKIWKSLEQYAARGKINQLGLADVDENVFRSIYEWANIKPSIIQINLATCCVVPPTLQAFCKDNEVQLLTHSDPTEILPEAAIENIFGRCLRLNWALRFSVHIKCRGVLTTKGYLLSLDCKAN